MKNNWYRSEHGHALIRDGLIVTGLLQKNLETEQDLKRWEGQKLRLHVNAGCGAIAVDEWPGSKPLNPIYKPVSWRLVPAHIRRDFRNAI